MQDGGKDNLDGDSQEVVGPQLSIGLQNFGFVKKSHFIAISIQI